MMDNSTIITIIITMKLHTKSIVRSQYVWMDGCMYLRGIQNV